MHRTAERETADGDGMLQENMKKCKNIYTFAHTLWFAANRNSIVHCFFLALTTVMNTYRLCCYIYCRSVDYFACIAVKRQWNSAVAERSRHCFILREWNQKPDAPLWCFWTAGMENVSFFSFFFSIKPVCFVRRGDITAFGRLSDRIRTTEGVNNNKRWCPGTRGTVSDGVLTSVGKKKKRVKCWILVYEAGECCGF